MLKRLKAKGLKICVWINSYVGQESSMFKEGVEGGYLKRPNGDVQGYGSRDLPLWTLLTLQPASGTAKS